LKKINKITEKYLALLLMLFVSSALFAQDNVKKPTIEKRAANVIKLGAIEPFFSTFSLAYERFIDETDISIQAKGSIAYRKITLWEAIEPQYLGYGLELQARYYMVIYNRDVPNGLYAGAFGKYAHKSAKLEVASGTITFIDGQGKTFGLLAATPIQKIYVKIHP
jgi:hypothetical protein